jgi:hypothetical protein
MESVARGLHESLHGSVDGYIVGGERNWQQQ